MRGILDRAARIAAGMARAIAYAPRDPEATFYGLVEATPSSAAATSSCATAPACSTPARMFHYLATVITPAMAHAQVGAGSAYAYTRPRRERRRARRRPQLPAARRRRTRRRRTSGRSTSTTPRPARCSRSPSTPYPALASNTGTLQADDDGSHDLYFGPTAPDGQGVQLDPDAPGQVLVRRSCGSTARSSRGSTSAGPWANSSRSIRSASVGMPRRPPASKV